MSSETTSISQTIIDSYKFRCLINLTIFVNCIFMACIDPTLGDSEQPLYQTAGGIIFSLIYIFEMFLKMWALGLIKYMYDTWNIIDCIIATTSIVDILLLIIIACAKLAGTYASLNITSNTDFFTLIKVLRLFRIMRALKAMNQIPSIKIYISALLSCGHKVVINAIIMFMLLLSASYFSFSQIGDKLAYRCTPTATYSTVFNGSEALYYQEYGQDFYYSKYNNAFCGGANAQCSTGFECTKLDLLPYQGVGGDFSSPFKAFVSNLSFLTLRGWPNIFWAIVDTQGLPIAVALLLLLFTFGNMMILNLLPATFIVNLKKSQEKHKTLETLLQYPGDIDTASQLDIMLWSVTVMKKNESVIDILFNMISKATAAGQDFYRKYFFFIGKTISCVSCLLSYLCCILKLCRTESDTTDYVNVDTKDKEEKTAGNNEIVDDDENATAKRRDDIRNADGLSSIRMISRRKKDKIEDDTGAKYIPEHLRGKRAVMLRKLLCDDQSYLAIFMNIVTAFNIFTLTLLSSNMAASVAITIYVSNIVCACLFLAELVIKVTLLGLKAYCSSWLNVLDFFVTVLSLPLLGGGGLTGSSTQIRLAQAARLIRSSKLLRFVGLFRLVRLVSMFTRARNAKASKDGSLSKLKQISLYQYMIIFVDILVPVFNMTIVLLLFTFIFALLGMSLFHGNFSDNAGIVNVSYTDYNQTITAPLNDLTLSWTAGKYYSRMNFNSFYGAYLTIFNISHLNGWYLHIINVLRATNEYSLIYYALVIFFNKYFLLATLLAAVVTIMEDIGNSHIANIAKDTDLLLGNVNRIYMKIKVYHSFQKIKEQVSQRKKIKLSESVNSRQKKLLDYDGSKTVEYLTCLYTRNSYSLYLFHEQNIFRVLCKRIYQSAVFRSLTTLAVIIVVIDVILDDVSMQWSGLMQVINIFFLGEMFLKTIADGFVFLPSAYLNHILRVVDLVINIFIILKLAGVMDMISALRVIRLFKILGLIKNVTQSRSLTLLLKSIRFSVPSVMMLLFMSLIFILFVSVIALQVWVGVFNHCSYDSYPSGASRFEESSTYPYGCDGTTVIASSYDNSTYYSQLSWVPYDDNFDDFFSSARSIYRIVFNNEFQGVLYSSLDVTGWDFEPTNGYSRGNFMLFMFISPISIALAILTIAVIYYHYYTAAFLSGRSGVFGQQMGFWNLYEEKLCTVRYRSKHSPHLSQLKHKLVNLDLSSVHHKIIDAPISFARRVSIINSWKALRKYIREVQESVAYRVVGASLCIVPPTLLVIYFDATYARRFWLIIDSFVSMIHVFDYVCRLFSKKKQIMKTIYSPWGFTNLAIHTFLVLVVLYTYSSLLAGRVAESYRQDSYYRLVFACIFLRIIPLHTLFADIRSYTKILYMSMSGFMPLCIYIFIITIMYTIFGVSAFNGVVPDYGDAWLNKHYNFRSYSSTWLLLLSVGTGNMYTEILLAYSNAGYSNILLGVMEGYFCSYSLIFFVLTRCFAIMVISKYLNHFSGDTGLCVQQITQFCSTWRVYAKSNGKKIDFHKLLELLKHLPSPLGKNSADLCYIDLCRFAKKVLLNMPSNAKNFDDFDQQKRRTMFTFQQLACEDIRGLGNIMVGDDKKAKLSSHAFTFKQVIIAVHRAHILNHILEDEIDDISARQSSRTRLAAVRCKILYLLAHHKSNKSDHQAGIKQHHTNSIVASSLPVNSTICETIQYNFLKHICERLHVAKKTLFLLQRVDYVTCNHIFNQVMEHTVLALRIRSASFGFKGIDIFILTLLRRALLHERRSVELRYALVKKTIGELTTGGGIKEELTATLAHYRNVQRLLNIVKHMYDSNVSMEWMYEIIRNAKGEEIEKIPILKKVHMWKGADEATAVAVDNANMIVAAFGNKGSVKVWIAISPSGNIEATSTFKLTQKFEVGDRVRSLLLCDDSKRLAVAAAHYVVVYSPIAAKGKSQQKKFSSFVEVIRYSEHNQPVNALLMRAQTLYSCSNDGYIYHWNFHSNEHVNYFHTGTCAYSLCIARVDDAQQTLGEDDRSSQVLVCGCSNGQIVLLPINNSTRSGSQWVGKVFPGSLNKSIAITSVKAAWGYLYTAFVDGSIKTWSLSHASGRNDSSSSDSNARIAIDVNKVNLLLLNSVTVHSGPVSSLLYTGGHLFSFSHDFSILPWNPPESTSKLSVETSGFTQTYDDGHIFHSDPILCSAGNKYCIVTGDEGGRVILTVPHLTNEILPFQSDTGIDNQSCHFSFLSHNFSGCCATHQGVSVEVRKVLHISNHSFGPMSIIPTVKNPNFRIELSSSSLSDAMPSTLVSSQHSTGHQKASIIIPSGKYAEYQIIFSPTEEMTYSTVIDFLINNSSKVKVQVSGYGIVPKLKLHDSLQIVDFELVGIGSTAMKRQTVNNLSNIDVFAHFVVETNSNNDKQFNDAEFSVEPKCCIIKANSSRDIALTFSPDKAHPTFQKTFSVLYFGGRYTLTTLRATSEAVSSAMVTTSDALPSAKASDKTSSMLSLPSIRHQLKAIPDAETCTYMMKQLGFQFISDATTGMNLFYHRNSGQFLELPTSHTDGGRNYRTSCNLFVMEYSFQSIVDVAYEVWVGNMFIATGKGIRTATNDVKHMIKLPAALLDGIDGANRNHVISSCDSGDYPLHKVVVEVYFFDSAVHAMRKPAKMNAVPKPKTTSDNNTMPSPGLVHVIDVGVLKGFQTQRASAHHEVEVVDRIYVIGIEKSVTIMNHIGTMTEYYDQSYRSPAASRFSQYPFPAAILTLNPTSTGISSHLAPVAFSIVDSCKGKSGGIDEDNRKMTDWLKLKNKTSAGTADTKGSAYGRTRAGSHSTSTEKSDNLIDLSILAVGLPRPKFSLPPTILLSDCTRRFKVKLFCKHSTRDRFTAATAKEIDRSTVGNQYDHEITQDIDGFVAQDVMGRYFDSTDSNIELLMPRHIRSSSSDISVYVSADYADDIDDADRQHCDEYLQHINAMFDKLIGNPRSHRDSCVLTDDCKWTVAICEYDLSLINPSPSNPMLSTNVALKLNGFSIKLDNNKTIITSGCTAKVTPYTATATSGGGKSSSKSPLNTSVVSDVNAINNAHDKLLRYECSTNCNDRIADIDYDALPLSFKNVWAMQVANNHIQRVKKGLVKLTEGRKHAAYIRLSKQASDILAKQQESEELKLRNRIKKNLTAGEMREREEAQAAASNLLNDSIEAMQTISSHDIMEDLIRVCSNDNTDKRETYFHYSDLRTYLQSVTLHDFDKPLTVIEIETAFRGLTKSRNATGDRIVQEFDFAKWWDKDVVREIKKEMTNTMIFACMLEEYVSNMEGDMCGYNETVSKESAFSDDNTSLLAAGSGDATHVKTDSVNRSRRWALTNGRHLIKDGIGMFYKNKKGSSTQAQAVAAPAAGSDASSCHDYSELDVGTEMVNLDIVAPSTVAIKDGLDIDDDDDDDDDDEDDDDEHDEDDDDSTSDDDSSGNSSSDDDSDTDSDIT